MTKATLSRRHLLAGASATAAASFVASARPAAAKAPLLKSQAPAFYRFNVEVGDVALECTSCGSGIPVVLLANAGCSVGYFDYLAGMLATRGLQAVSINMRGVAGSRGSLDGTTLHDLAGDVAGVIEAIGCGPAHLVGHAFGNRIARCLAVDQPPLVRSVTLLAAGGLIGPPTPVGTPFRNAKQSKMNGSDCVTVLGARWLSPASDPKILERVECWPAIFIAHLATSRNVPLEQWWSGGDAPLLAIQGLDDEVAPPGNGHALRERVGERVRVVDLPRAGHFLLLEQPEAVTRTVAEFVGAEAVPRCLLARDREEPKCRGYFCRNAPSSGTTLSRPNETGRSTRSRPIGVTLARLSTLSASSRSAKMRRQRGTTTPVEQSNETSKNFPD